MTYEAWVKRQRRRALIRAIVAWAGIIAGGAFLTVAAWVAAILLIACGS